MQYQLDKGEQLMTCACTAIGVIKDRRAIEKLTIRYEVDIKHLDGTLHTNLVVFNGDRYTRQLVERKTA